MALIQLSIRPRESAYRDIIAEAARIRRKAELGAEDARLWEQLAKAEREFRTERRRDYFRSPLRKEAADALKAAREAVREQGSTEGFGAGSGS